MDGREEMKDVTVTCGHTDRLDGLCNRCKIYLCNPCQVAKHFDHIEEIRGLDSLLTEAISQYSQMGGALEKDLVASKSSVKDGAIDEALLGMEKRIADEYDKLTKDLQDVQEEQVAAFSNNPLVTRLQQEKEALEGEELRRLTAFDQKLGRTISTLLSALAEEKYDGVAGLLSEQSKEEFTKEAERFEAYYERQKKFKQDVETLQSVRTKLTYDTKTIDELVQIHGVHEAITKLLLYEKKSNAVYVHMPKTHRLTRCETKHPQLLHKFAQARLEDHSLLLCGGKKKPKTYSSTSWIYDVVHKQSRDIASMKTERASHAAISKLDVEVFVAGGENAKGLLRDAERYDVKANQWTQLPSLVEAKRNLTLCLCGEKHLYAIGGCASQEVATVEYLHVIEGKAWELRPVHGAPQLQKTGVVPIADNQILVFGGKAANKKLRQTYLYDMSNLTVTAQATLPGEATNMTFNKSDNKMVEGMVYATGNSKGQTFIYDIKAKTWACITREQYLLTYNWE